MAKKKAVKKKAVSKRKKTNGKISVVITKKILGEAPEKKQFILSDGKKIKSVYKLIDELTDMNDDVFRAHVNESRNDFANWVSDVFNEKKFAEEMRQMSDRMDTQRKLMHKVIKEVEKLAKKKR